MSLVPVSRLKQIAHLDFSSLKEFSTTLPQATPLILARWKINLNDSEFPFHINWYNMLSVLSAQIKVNNISDTSNFSFEQSNDDEVSYSTIDQLQTSSLTYVPQMVREFDLIHGAVDVGAKSIFFRLVMYRATGVNDTVFIKSPSLFCYVPLQAGNTFVRLST